MTSSSLFDRGNLRSGNRQDELPEPLHMNSPFIDQLERDLRPVLAAIEARGLIVDVAKLGHIIDSLQEQRNLAEANAYHLFSTSHRINLNSSQELAKLMVDLGIHQYHFPATKSGKVSTAKAVLERIDHPAIEHVIQYRSCTKLISSLASYYNAVDRTTSRLYYQFTNDCASGRLYTKDMSIQNLPREGRAAIIPGEGKVFISADYDSFELHILSALAGDTYFRRCWQQGIDLHKQVVADMMHIPYDEVTDAQRRIGKVLNFGILYGQQAPGVAQSLGIRITEARELMDAYESRIAEIMAFKKSAVEAAREHGYVETYYGRCRPLPDLKSPNRSRRLKAERQVVNTAVQGSGADIAKIVMLRLHRAGWQIDAMLHDGFLLSVDRDTVEESIPHLRELMEMDLEGVRLTVSFKVGESWGDCK